MFLLQAEAEEGKEVAVSEVIRVAEASCAATKDIGFIPAQRAVIRRCRINFRRGMGLALPTGTHTCVKSCVLTGGLSSDSVV